MQWLEWCCLLARGSFPIEVNLNKIVWTSRSLSANASESLKWMVLAWVSFVKVSHISSFCGPTIQVMWRLCKWDSDLLTSKMPVTETFKMSWAIDCGHRMTIWWMVIHLSRNLLNHGCFLIINSLILLIWCFLIIQCWSHLRKLVSCFFFSSYILWSHVVFYYIWLNLVFSHLKFSSLGWCFSWYTILPHSDINSSL